MRVKHKVHLPRNPKPVEVDPAYQAEVDRSTAKLERAYRDAQRRVERAAGRLRKAEAGRVQAAQLRGLRAEWERRVADLAELERLMQASPAGAAHRGTRGWQKAPR